jgi:predicted Fe-Mo cluster-binding NifX family protein
MRIAVTSRGQEITSDMDPRFGRASYILIVDSDGGLIESIDNGANAGAMRGAGIQAAKLLADRNVEVLLTGHCGPNAVKTLNAAKIKVGVEQSGKVSDAVERFKRNEVAFTQTPNVEGHW